MLVRLLPVLVQKHGLLLQFPRIGLIQIDKLLLGRQHLWSLTIDYLLIIPVSDCENRVLLQCMGPPAVYIYHYTACAELSLWY